MEEVTRKLLQECSQGCQMAVASMNQVSPHVNGDQLNNVIQEYKKKHEQLGKKADDMLKEGGAQRKEPGMAASAFAWMTAEVKMKLHDDNSQIARLMMNGCNMGIQSISGFMNDYVAASEESMSLARDLVHMEEDFMKDLKDYL
jgi:hypothetical protein